MRPRHLLPALILSAALQAAPVPPLGQSTSSTESTASISETPATELNLRSLGAIGDSRPHPVSEWITQKRYKNLRDIQKDYPFVTSLDWSTDEVAFQQALRSLPPEGGTIRIPPGRYVATAYGWRIDRDHVRLLGSGMRDTMLSTGPNLDEGLVLAPYRHVGWLTGTEQEFAFAPDAGVAGAKNIRLRDPKRAADLKPGDLVFIRNGACRFDQDYGEFNEVAATAEDGDVSFKYPLARDYTLASLNWAAETAEPFKLPSVGKTARIQLRTGEGFFPLPQAGAITLGEALLEIVRADNTGAVLRNPGCGNPPPGTILPAGTPIAKSRAIIKLTRSTRDFSAQGLRVFGRRKALNLSNSYESSFIDCDFVRQPDATVQGGLTLDADGGRFATFTRCSFRGTAPAPMQIARSFGDLTFTRCTFVSTNVVFSEFAFGGVLEHSQLHVPASLGSAIVVGRSCGDLRIEDNQIVVTGGKLTLFDTGTDIHAQKLDAPGELILRNNKIVAPVKPLLFLLGDRPSKISGNTLNNIPVEPPQRTEPPAVGPVAQP